MRTNPTFETELATILGSTETTAIARAAGLKILPVCGRCGGSGHYSFNQINGTVCFDCGGCGMVRPKSNEQAAVLTEAKLCVSDGRLDTYMESLAARKRVKAALKKVMAAWLETGISGAYRWQDATKEGRDMDISKINKKMADAHTAVSDAVYKIPRPTSEGYQAAVTFADQQYALAIEAINQANIEFKEYLEQNPS